MTNQQRLELQSYTRETVEGVELTCGRSGTAPISPSPRLSTRRTGRRRRARAFTLVELLIVIGIIGLLAAMLMTALARGKRHSKMMVCLNNLRQVGIAMQMFVEDHNQLYPGGLGGHEIAQEFWCTPDIQRLTEMTQRPLFPYMAHNSEVWDCPEDKGLDFRSDGPFFGPTLHYAFGCSYKFNSAPWKFTRYLAKGTLPGKTIQWVENPSAYIAVYEPPARPMVDLVLAPDMCHLVSPAPVPPYYYFHWHFNTGASSVDDSATKDHQKAISPILFVDGHGAKHDFTKALHQEPKLPTETTKDWIWYQPVIDANGQPVPRLN